MKEVRVWFYLCENCGWESDPYLDWHDVKQKDECPKCFSHLKLVSDYAYE